MYSLGTDVIMQVYVTGEPHKSTDVVVQRYLLLAQILSCKSVVGKPLKALILWCRGALFCFYFWDGKQNFVPNMLQAVFANVFIEGRVVSDVNGFLDGPGHILTLLSYNLEVSTDVIWLVTF